MCGKIYIQQKVSLLSFWNVQSGGFNCIHAVVQPSPPSIFRTYCPIPNQFPYFWNEGWHCPQRIGVITNKIRDESAWHKENSVIFLFRGLKYSKGKPCKPVASANWAFFCKCPKGRGKLSAFIVFYFCPFWPQGLGPVVCCLVTVVITFPWTSAARC